MDTSLWVLFALILTTAVYSAFLQRIQRHYVPDYIWVTVVVGNAIVGGAFAIWLWLDPIPPGTTAPLAAFWRLLACNVAAGVPVIAWQIGQAAARSQQRTTPPPGASSEPPAPAAPPARRTSVE